MGEARRRGTREERVAQARKRAEEQYSKACEAELAYWNSLTEEEKELIRGRERRRKQALTQVASLLMTYGGRL